MNTLILKPAFKYFTRQVNAVDVHAGISCEIFEVDSKFANPDLLAASVNEYFYEEGIYPFGNPTFKNKKLFEPKHLPSIPRTLAIRLLTLSLYKDLAHRSPVMEKRNAEVMGDQFVNYFSASAKFYSNFDNVEKIVSHYEQESPPSEGVGCSVLTSISNANFCEGVFAVDSPYLVGWLFVSDSD